jgi:hypothetical protein
MFGTFFVVKFIREKFNKNHIYLFLYTLKYMLKNILSISGKSGLYKLVSRGKNMLIVETLADGKRMPAYNSDKVVALSDVSMFTRDGEIRLNEVLKKLFDRENGAEYKLDGKTDNEALKKFMGELVPEYDRNKVYPSDIKKLIQWYNILTGAGFTDFTVKEEESEENADKKETLTAEGENKDKPKKSPVKQAVKVQDKKMQTTKQTRTKV